MGTTLMPVDSNSRKQVGFGRLAGIIGLWIGALVSFGAIPSVAHTQETSVRLVSARSATLSAEVAGRILHLGFREGESFEQGDLLVAIDCTTHQARLLRAEAIRDRGLRLVQTQETLSRSGATSGLELANAEFELQAATAELRLSEIAVERCELTAPFDGAVVAARIQEHEYVNEGQPIIEIIDLLNIEVQTFVPSHLLAWLREDETFEVRLSEVDIPLVARVARIAPAIDPVTQSVTVYGRLEAEDYPQLLRPGMSGFARFTAPTERVQ